MDCIIQRTVYNCCALNQRELKQTNNQEKWTTFKAQQVGNSSPFVLCSGQSRLQGQSVSPELNALKLELQSQIRMDRDTGGEGFNSEADEVSLIAIAFSILPPSIKPRNLMDME